MCNPAFIAAIPALTAVTSVATAGVSIAQQRQRQNDTLKLRENQAESLVKDYNFQQKNLENEAISQQDAVENELFNKNIEAANARASNIANVASTGVSGNTVNALDNDINSQIGREQNDINRNYDIFQQSSQSASDSNYNTLTSALTGLSGNVAGPGFLDSALKLGSAASSGYDTGSGYEKRLTDGYVKP